MKPNTDQLTDAELHARMDEQERAQMGMTGRELREIYDIYTIADLMNMLHYLTQAVERMTPNPNNFDLQRADLKQRIEQIRYLMMGRTIE